MTKQDFDLILIESFVHSTKQSYFKAKREEFKCDIEEYCTGLRESFDRLIEEVNKPDYEYCEIFFPNGTVQAYIGYARSAIESKFKDPLDEESQFQIDDCKISYPQLRTKFEYFGKPITLSVEIMTLIGVDLEKYLQSVALVEPEQKELNRKLKCHIEINFNETSPEYYLKKSVEIVPQIPEWPDDPKEAFDLFKNYYAQKNLLIEAYIFLNQFFTWNEKAINDKLNQINLFIEKAKKIDLKKAFNNSYAEYEYNEYLYLRFSNDFYNHKHIKNEADDIGVFYGKYFLFKDLLESKLNKQQMQEAGIKIESARSNELKQKKMDDSTPISQNATTESLERIISLSGWSHRPEIRIVFEFLNDNYLRDANDKEFSAFAFILYQTGYYNNIRTFEGFKKLLAEAYNRKPPLYKPNAIRDLAEKLKVKYHYLDKLPTK